MTIARLPIITALVDPVATATAVFGLCVASVDGARTPLLRAGLPTLVQCRQARFAGSAAYWPSLATRRSDRTLAAVAFNSP